MKLFGINIGKHTETQQALPKELIPENKRHATRIASSIIGSGEIDKHPPVVQVPASGQAALRKPTTAKETHHSVFHMPKWVRSFINWCKGESSPNETKSSSWHFLDFFKKQIVAPAEKVAVPSPEVSVSMIKSAQMLPCLHAMCTYMTSTTASGNSRLDTVGIFRLSPGFGDKKAVISELLKAETTPDFALQQNYDHAEVNPVPFIIKDFVKAAKILTPEQQNTFLEIRNLPDEEKAAKIDEKINALPEDKQALLIELLGLLKEVATHKDKNRMDFNNLGVVFGPNLFPNVEVEDTMVANKAVADMIQYGRFKSLEDT